ncbi:hypothetical protein C818_00982 [Lachnospiraceae bacterium MD308]|nr:hypothetical protein C818_00982 [Lachnospiraceae bacterium MD308]
MNVTKDRFKDRQLHMEDYLKPLHRLFSKTILIKKEVDRIYNGCYYKEKLNLERYKECFMKKYKANVR